MLSIRTTTYKAVVSEAGSAAGTNAVGFDDGDHDAPASEPGVVTERVRWAFTGRGTSAGGDETDPQSDL